MQKNVLFSASNLLQNIVRSYARKAALKSKIANPGIQKRLNILDEREEAKLENIDVEEYESDFMNVGETHREHEKELKHYREKEKYWIVKQKYFKENKINFLTWNDKEQIRYLHQTNPTEWTIEKLVEGYPALPETITRIIKGKWQIKNESKKQNHDEAVEKNWKLLKQGKLSNVLPPNLLSHLIKFSSRKQNNIDNLEDDRTVVSNTKLHNNNEFSSIINSYEKIKSRNEIKTESNKSDEYCKRANVIENKLKSYGNKDVTLNLIKDNHTNKNESTNIIKDTQTNKNESTNIIKDTHTNKNESEVNYLENIFQKSKTEKNNLPQKYNNIAKSVTEKNLVLSYPEKIKIPKDKYKKGKTYKVNDCYYDDDGEFLYRVPGMY